MKKLKLFSTNSLPPKRIVVRLTGTCLCVARAGYPMEQVFTNREQAYRTALDMVENLNNRYCGKHRFSLEDDGLDYRITLF